MLKFCSMGLHSGSRDLLKFWDVSANISETVQYSYTQSILIWLHSIQTRQARTYSVRDLGINVTNYLSPSDHVMWHCRKGPLIHRCFVSRNTDLLVRAFKVYVRPLLEYNSVIWWFWSPSTIQDIEAIERVRRFTKRLHWLHSLPYKLRLQCFYLQSLEHRRLLTDLIWYVL